MNCVSATLTNPVSNFPKKMIKTIENTKNVKANKFLDKSSASGQLHQVYFWQQKKLLSTRANSESKGMRAP